MNVKQEALAAEIRAEMGRQNIKAAPIQRALGISSTAWGTWFVQCTRDVPISVVMSVAEYLGVTTSELLRRAEVAAGAKDPITAALEGMLSPEGRAAVEKGRAAHRDAGHPQVTTRGRSRRSA